MFFYLLAIIDLQQAFASIETWVAAVFAFLVSSLGVSIVVGVIVRILIIKVNKQTSVSEGTLKSAANLGAEKAVKKMVGKSFNVNIKSEVDKAVKEELKPIREKAEYAAVASRNAEIAAAHVLLAQSRSRLLNETEQANLQSIANKILSHANGEIVAPTIIEIVEQKQLPDADVEDEQECKEKENSALVSFADVE